VKTVLVSVDNEAPCGRLVYVSILWVSKKRPFSICRDSCCYHIHTFQVNRKFRRCTTKIHRRSPQQAKLNSNTYKRHMNIEYALSCNENHTQITRFTFCSKRPPVRPHQAGYKNCACWNGCSSHKSNIQFL